MTKKSVRYIKYNGVNLFSCAGVTLKPGTNEVEMSDEHFDEFCAYNSVKVRVEEGAIELDAPGLPQGKPSSELSAKDKIALIKETMDLGKVKELREGEERTTVLAALDEQEALLDPRASEGGDGGEGE